MDEKKLAQTRERLLYAVGKYSDYKRYAQTLDQLEDEYDETVEIYHWDMWTGDVKGTITEKAGEMLGVTARIFYDLEWNAEKELFFVLKEIMQNGREEQMAVLGFYWKESEFSEELYEQMLMEWEDAPYVQKEALESFLEHAEAFLSQEKRKEQGQV